MIPADRRQQRLATALCFFGPLALYLFTAARTAQGGDTIEFALLGNLGGVAHPPGYPLYTMLARIGGALPIGTPFYRVAIISALGGAGAVAVLQRIALRLTGNLAASIAAALAFAVCREQWRLAGLPEVFALHMLLTALIVWAALELVEDPKPGRALALGLASGLSLSNHLTTIFVIPIILWAFVASARKGGVRQTSGLLALAAVGVAVGLLSYLELVWAARHAGSQAMVWGDTSDWRGFRDHVLRTQYGTFSLTVGNLPNPGRHLVAYLSSIPSDIGFVWLLPAVLGIGLAFKERRGFAAALLASLLLSGVVFIARFNLPDDPTGRETEQRFYLLPHFLLFPFVAWGVALLVRRVRPVMAGFVIAAALLVPMVRNFRAADWRSDDSIERVLMAVVDGVSPDGVLAGRGDLLLSGTAWVTRVLRFRPDVRYIDAYLLVTPWYFDQIQRACPECGLKYQRAPRSPGQVAVSVGSHVAAFTTHPPSDLPANAGVSVVEAGLVDQIVPGWQAPLSADLFRQRLDRASSFLPSPNPPVDAWSGTMQSALGQLWLNLARRYAQEGNEAEAQTCLRRASEYLWE